MSSFYVCENSPHTRHFDNASAVFKYTPQLPGARTSRSPLHSPTSPPQTLACHLTSHPASPSMAATNTPSPWLQRLPLTFKYTLLNYQFIPFNITAEPATLTQGKHHDSIVMKNIT